MNLEQALQLVEASVEERVRKEAENEKAVIQFLFEHDCSLARKLVDKAQELLMQVETDIKDVVSSLKANPLAHQILPEDEKDVNEVEVDAELEVEVKNGKNYLKPNASFNGGVKL